MEQTGPKISRHGLEAQGFRNLAAAHWNYGTAALVETAVAAGEGDLSKDGALVVQTGEHTGRSAGDKFTVRDATTENTIWWDNNKAMSPAHFDALEEAFLAYAQGKELFVQDLHGGADLRHRVKVRIVTELAWHSLFVRHLLLRPEMSELEDFLPEFTIVDFPGFRADPARHGTVGGTVIGVNFTKKLILIGGTSYAGEMKKSVFTILNFLLPAKRVMPMHCSANVGADGASAIFFGLSGTGKTTLSADASRTLIGDDEHGWSESGVFNFEGGCYAKTIRLSAEAEPQIFAASQRFGTVLENIVMDPITREVDFDDQTKTENTRSAYPLDFIPNASRTGRAGIPKNIVMLTADAFGVMPPIAKLTPAEAMYHFLSGYTAKVAGTERGLTGVEPEFSTCFGSPFLPRHPSEYANLLRDFIDKHHVDCWLVNTGWTGGKYGTGRRMPIKATRTLLSAALDGSLKGALFRRDDNFGFQVPVSVPEVDTKILDPRSTWANGAAYDKQAGKLVDMFITNFEKFEDQVDGSVRDAAPGLKVAAE